MVPISNVGIGETICGDLGGGICGSIFVIEPDEDVTLIVLGGSVIRLFYYSKVLN